MRVAITLLKRHVGERRARGRYKQLVPSLGAALMTARHKISSVHIDVDLELLRQLFGPGELERSMVLGLLTRDLNVPLAACDCSGWYSGRDQ